MGDNRGGMSPDKDGSALTRRRILQGADGIIAAATLPSPGAKDSALALSQEAPKAAAKASADVTGRAVVFDVVESRRGEPLVKRTCSVGL